MCFEDGLELVVGQTARKAVTVDQERRRRVHLERLVAGHALFAHLGLEILVVAALIEFLRRYAAEPPDLLQTLDRIGAVRPAVLRGEQDVDKTEETIRA